MSADLPVTIGIATRNRPDNLSKTVEHLAKMVCQAAELLVVDDGSDLPISIAPTALPFPVRVIRHERSLGYIAARNVIARECRTQFVLSCDDDSYPISGDVADAIAYLAHHPEFIALSFPYIEGPMRKAMNPSTASSPYPVRQFIGCSHLMRVSYFRELGGYWEWLVQQNEERELCYRALSRAWGVAHYPGVTFYHDYAPAGRNWSRHEYFTMRNEMAVELKYAPRSIGALKLIRNLSLACLWALRNRRTGYLRGYFSGIASQWAGGVQRGPRLSLKRYARLEKLAWM
ncbi:MAG TPA: glycosyltransferase [Opitutaceae bacterium]|jgi:GT2 family glycosyltransferase